jgi:hypothetical protein
MRLILRPCGMGVHDPTMITASALRYLEDRTDTPRDLTPEERQWVIDALGTSSTHAIILHRTMTRSTLKAARRFVRAVRVPPEGRVEP